MTQKSATALDRELLLAVAEAIRFIDFDGVVPKDVMVRLAGAEAELRFLLAHGGAA